jgi:hypothetical protein
MEYSLLHHRNGKVALKQVLISFDQPYFTFISADDKDKVRMVAYQSMLIN